MAAEAAREGRPVRPADMATGGQAEDGPAWVREADRPREECGVFAIYSDRPIEAAFLTYLGLYALQHRGQESAGMAVSDGVEMRLHKGMGLVAQVFDEDVLNRLHGRMALGHVRYSTTGASHPMNAQPLMGYCAHGQVALAHNGNLTNTRQLRAELQEAGAVFQTTTDSEVILHLVAQSGQPLPEALAGAAARLRGAFAVVAMTNREMVGLRDPLGIRPLCLGRLGDAWVLASESCALSTVGAELVRDVEPGEMVVIGPEGLTSRRLVDGERREAFCVFEFIYFARPDSVLAGRNVHLVRKAIGRVLAREAPVAADIVIAAPDSAVSAAMGYAEEAGIPLEMGLIRNRYVGRTFIQPTPAMRRLGVKIKLNPLPAVLQGKRVVLVDDSIVRGTTSAAVIRMLREAGAREVHMRVASPPFRHPCFYGVDVPTHDELVASQRTPEEVCRLIGADSLHYLSFEGLYEAVGIAGGRLCTACFSGRYPVPPEGEGAGGKPEGEVHLAVPASRPAGRRGAGGPGEA